VLREIVLQRLSLALLVYKRGVVGHGMQVKSIKCANGAEVRAFLIRLSTQASQFLIGLQQR
jgi:hypothetical protein